jgi:hypothetical protein
VEIQQNRIFDQKPTYYTSKTVLSEEDLPVNLPSPLITSCFVEPAGMVFHGSAAVTSYYQDGSFIFG